MLEALCRQSSTTLDIVHVEDGPPITQRTSGLELLKRLQAASERGRTIPEFNTHIGLQRLARGGYLVARAGLELVNYRITQRGKDAVVEHDLN